MGFGRKLFHKINLEKIFQRRWGTYLYCWCYYERTTTARILWVFRYYLFNFVCFWELEINILKELAAAGVTKGPILVLLNEKINDNLITMDFLKEKFDPKFEYTANIPEGQKLASEPSLRFPNRINQNNSTYEYKLSHTQRPIKFLTISAIKG